MLFKIQQSVACFHFEIQKALAEKHDKVEFDNNCGYEWFLKRPDLTDL